MKLRCLPFIRVQWIFSLPVLIFLLAPVSPAQEKLLDGFESVDAWRLVASEGVTISAHIVPGLKGSALRLDFDFSKGAGYCGIHRTLPMELPANYRFSFFLRGEAPRNNLEFKLIDASGDNVWWRNQRQYEFPQNWRKVVIKKRQIEFAWGPTAERNLAGFDKLEIFIASSSGGKGSVYFDELTFQQLDPALEQLPQPVISTSSAGKTLTPSTALMDQQLTTVWHSALLPGPQQIDMDFTRTCEIGGLTIDWDEKDFARRYQIESSLDGVQYQKLYTIDQGRGGRDYIPLKELEIRYLRLVLLKSAGRGYAIREITPQKIDFSDTPEDLYRAIARDARRGCYPRYLLDEQSYWTVVGVPGDRKEALLNEDGAVEVDQNGFSIEPFLVLDDRLYCWADVERYASLRDGFLPMPTVTWRRETFQMDVTAFAIGQPGAAKLFITYALKNRTDKVLYPELMLAVRPFQVNPPWQFLNTPGGISPVRSIRRDGKTVVVNGQKKIHASRLYDELIGRSFVQGDVSAYLQVNRWPTFTDVEDSLGFASGAMRWRLRLPPRGGDEITLEVPFDAGTDSRLGSPAALAAVLDSLSGAWTREVDRVEFHVPPAGQKIIDVMRSNLAYILINRDGPGIQPGSRSYDRSWIRDGALTSAALLRFGLIEPVKEFLDWYAAHLFPSGKVPCVVDQRGPDPVPENDSHGQFIFAFWQYYLFTGDAGFLKQHFEQISAVVAYMDSLTRLRSGDEYRLGSDSLRAFYGLLPESISHEGYSAKPMHSYWDDFFALLGYKDAVEIAGVLGRDEEAEKWAASRDLFRTNLYNSLKLAIKNKKIDYIPGCVELGDFDATSTAVALFPCNEWQNLPQPQGRNTFDRYFDFFIRRLDPQVSYREYTPYEVRLIGAFVRMNEPDRAWKLIDFFLSCQRPPGWNHWAEVVWKDARTPRFIGDMPHTWVGSDFINSARALFAYEDEQEQSLVLGAGLPAAWMDSPEGVSVRHLPTYYGLLDYSISKSDGGYQIKLGGLKALPAGGLRVHWWGTAKPKEVRVDGADISDFEDDWIRVNSLPAVLDIR